MTARETSAAGLQQALAESERACDAAVAQLAHFQEQRRNEQREEQHDLRNLLAVVRAIARRSADGVQTVEEYCGLLDGRLSAYLHAQATVARERPSGVDLLALIADELLRFDIRVGEDVDLQGPPVRLTARAAGLMALAFHEFASELILTGLDHRRDALRVDWRMEPGEPEVLRIEWRSSGPHAEEALASRWSAWLVQAIRHQLAGTLARTVSTEAMVLDLRLPAGCWRLA